MPPTGEPRPAGLGRPWLTGLAALVLVAEVPGGAGGILVADPRAFRPQFPGTLRWLEHLAEMHGRTLVLPAVLSMDPATHRGTFAARHTPQPLGTRAALARGQTRRRALAPLRAQEALGTTGWLIHPARTPAAPLAEKTSLAGVLLNEGEHRATLSLLPLPYQHASTDNGFSINGLEGRTRKTLATLLVCFAGAVQTHVKQRSPLEETSQLWLAVRVRTAVPAVGQQ